MITCAEAVRELWNYLDGLVDETERAAVEKHLDVCRRCCGELEFAEELRDFLAKHGSETQLPQAVQARLLRTLDDLDAPR
jgi:mycothiol system anti-sigma-R factor